MIGLDTNVLLRLFIEDDPAQCERAEALSTPRRPRALASSIRSFLPNSLGRLQETKRKRPEVAHLVEGVLSVDDLEIPHRRAARDALLAYRTGKADFPDYFIAEINSELGCASTATFDAAALDAPSFSPVP